MENIEDISRRIFQEIFKLIFGARLVINQETIYIPVSRIQFLFNLVKRTERRLFENSPDHKHLSPPFSWNILNPRTIRSGKKRVGGRPVSNQRERERNPPLSLSRSVNREFDFLIYPSLRLNSEGWKFRWKNIPLPRFTRSE